MAETLAISMVVAVCLALLAGYPVALGLITLPVMIRDGDSPSVAAGPVAAPATLAQIFPPATVLVLLGDQLGNAYQAAQLTKGVFAPRSVSVVDLFAGALFPGLCLVALYLLYLVGIAIFRPAMSPPIPPDPEGPRGIALLLKLAEVLVAPILLILAVLGSILGGIATPTEAASVGAVRAMAVPAL